MLFRILLWGLLFYVAYKFIFDFLVPVITATRQVKKQVREFQTRMQEQEKESPGQSGFAKTTHNNPVSKEDYIDFEEIK